MTDSPGASNLDQRTRTLISEFLRMVKTVIADGDGREEQRMLELYNLFLYTFFENPMNELLTATTSLSNVRRDDFPKVGRVKHSVETDPIRYVVALLGNATSILNEAPEIEDSLREHVREWFQRPGTTRKPRSDESAMKAGDYLLRSVSSDEDFYKLMMALKKGPASHSDLVGDLRQVICHHSFATETDIQLVLSLISTKLFAGVCGEPEFPGGDFPPTHINILGRWLLASSREERIEASADLLRKFLLSIRTTGISNASDVEDLFGRLADLENMVAYLESKVGEPGFYRDHLDHPIRVLLLVASILAECQAVTCGDDSLGITVPLLLSALFHDIGYPVSLRNHLLTRTDRQLYDAFKSVRKEEFIDERSNCLMRLLDLCSRANLHTKDYSDSFDNLPTHNVSGPLRESKTLVEGMMIEEPTRAGELPHGLISGFEYILHQISPFENYTNNICAQAMALHDIEWIEQTDCLKFSEFPAACLLLVVDEMQEWGRRVALFDKSPIEDCGLSFDWENNNKVLTLHMDFDLTGFDRNSNGMIQNPLAFVVDKYRKLHRVEFDSWMQISVTYRVISTSGEQKRLSGIGKIVTKSEDGKTSELLGRENVFIWDSNSSTIISYPNHLENHVDTVFLDSTVSLGKSRRTLSLGARIDGKKKELEFAEEEVESMDPVNISPIEDVRGVMLYRIRECDET